MKLKPRAKRCLAVILFILVVALPILFFPQLRRFADPEFVRDYLLRLGPWGYAVYILIFLLSIPLPVPSTPLAVAGGYVFGLLLGTVLTMIAALIGASIAFGLVRRYGEPVLEKMVGRKHIEHFNHIFRRRGLNGAILAYAIPVFPSDSINFMLGLSKIRYHTFLLVAILGNIPRYVLITAFGQGLFTGFSLQTGLISVIVAVYLLLAIFREKVKRLVFKELKELEQEAKIIEKDVEKEVEWVEEEVGMKRKRKSSPKKYFRRGILKTKKK